ncbi:sensor histidine kinase [Streptomyces laurentii]|uniref:sensor histidine kinase n=1 Tax=Streptomyces laurentii TaxID=39478 RepID=UPI0036980E47
MELATPPPTAQAPAAWRGWWLLPLGLGGGTAAATFMSADRISTAVAGLAATAASAVCVRLLLRTRAQEGRAAEIHRAELAQASQQWQKHVADMERHTSSGIAEQAHRYEAQLTEQAHRYEAQLTDQAHQYEAQLVERSAAFEARLAEETRALQQRADQLLAAVARLGDVQLPDAMRRLRDGEAIDDILPPGEHRSVADAGLQAGLDKILKAALTGIEAEIDRSASAEQAVISIGSRIHVLTSLLRGRLHELQGEHGRLPAVARGLMELDQALGPADGLAASIGVLAGSDRPGRQWQEPQPLLSVVRGGVGRIKEFQRVELRRLPELGVDGRLVDHLTLLIAHLLDNATRYSPPTEPVVVSGKEVPNGVGIEIQDSGKGLSEEKKREVEHALAGSAPGAGLGGISEDANIGLRVVGKIARRYGIRVTFADSAWLGTSVVLVVPYKYFSPLAAPVAPNAPATPAAPAASAMATVSFPTIPEAEAPASVPSEDAPEAPPAVGDAAGTTPGGLPRRRRRSDASSAATTPSEQADRATVDAVPSDASFAGLAAFAAAGRDARTSAPVSRTSGADHDTTAGGPSTEHRTEESD